MEMKVHFSGIDFFQDLGPLFKSFYPGVELINLTDKQGDSQHNNKGDCKLTEKNLCVEHLTTAYKTKKVLSDGDILADSILADYEFITDEEHFEIIDKGVSVCNELLVNSTGNFRSDYRNQLMRALYRVLSEKTKKSLPWGILTGVRPAKICYDRLEQNLVGNISYMVENFYCSPKKAGLAQKVAGRELQMLNELKYEKGYSLYVGIPFCPSICNYCTFGSHPIGKYEYLVEPYIDALCKEIEATKDLINDKELQTVYLGGGTPTAISAEQLERVIRKVRECFDFTHVRELTVEAGRPDSITEEKLQMLKNNGVTRISINPQTMRQKTLDIIGRKHTTEQTISAFNLARKVGFDNINMDLIAGLSGENEEDMKYTLAQIEKLDPDSITVHTLALKRAARLNTESESFVGLEASGVPEMVEYAAEYMHEHGLWPYYMYRQKNMTENLENVGYAKPGKEGFYNVLIMEERQMILALGAGASSKFVCKGDERFGRVENVKSVVDYVARIDEMIQRKLSAFK